MALATCAGNYGCLPQTWEDPNVKGDANVDGAFGDDDPVDVVEIGAASLEMGSFTPVKVLGCLSMSARRLAEPSATKRGGRPRRARRSPSDRTR